MRELYKNKVKVMIVLIQDRIRIARSSLQSKRWKPMSNNKCYKQ